MDLINLHKHMKEARVWGDLVSKDNSYVVSLDALTQWNIHVIKNITTKRAVILLR